MNNKDRASRYALRVDYIEDEGFVAYYKELGLSATGHGETREEAITDLGEAISALMEVAVEPWPEDPLKPSRCGG